MYLDEAPLPRYPFQQSLAEEPLICFMHAALLARRKPQPPSRPSLEKLAKNYLAAQPMPSMRNWRVLQRQLFKYAKSTMQDFIDSPNDKSRLTARVSWAALTAVFRAVPFDPAYLAHKQAKRLVLVARLSEEPFVQQAIGCWHKEDDVWRERALRRIGTIHDKAFSHADFKFAPVQSLTLEDHGEGAPAGTGSEEEVFINTGHASWRNFRQTLQFFLHEKDHNHQAQLSEAVQAGAIPKSSCLYPQGKMFGLFFLKSPILILPKLPHYKGVLTDDRAYSAQIIEREAVETSHLAETIHKAAARRRIQTKRPAATP